MLHLRRRQPCCLLTNHTQHVTHRCN